MSELLLEIFCEEIPAGMQARACADLEKALTAALAEAGLKPGAVKSWVGARRLGVCVEDLPAKAEDVREERKGPRVGAPDKALEGFLRGAGLASIDLCETREDKKGEYYVAVIDKPGRQTAEVVAEAVPAILTGFHWPKSMRIGEGEKTQRWVRPIQRLLCLFDGEVVDLEVFGIKAGNVTEGHRVHGRGPFAVTSYAEYAAVLRDQGYVILDADERKTIILDGARKVCAEAGLELVEDQGLLNEVAGLVEWPVPLLGEMDPDFLDLPPEVIQLTMKTHQKYFAVRKPGEEGVTSKFAVIANQEAPDGGVAIAAGNARVLSARLSDARHFWDNDRKKALESFAEELSKITFHEKLGTVADRVERIASLGRDIAERLGLDAKLVNWAARLCKADLVTEMVYEFPELQGQMGAYYAIEQGEHPLVSGAIADHYRPQGPADSLPGSDVASALALADKLDVLTGFWAIGEKPTGSKDPFALRRAALGVIRIMLEREVRLPLAILLENQFHYLHDMVLPDPAPDKPSDAEFAQDLLAFFADRLKVHLREDGVRHDVIDAVFGLGDDDLVRVANRSKALQAFLETEDGAALFAGYKRAANILRAEEKKGGERFEGLPEAGYLEAAPEAAERDLIAALEKSRLEAQAAIEDEDFTEAMSALSRLRAPVDRFFDDVTVNADEPALRRNRLLLLNTIREAVRAVADFDKLEG